MHDNVSKCASGGNSRLVKAKSSPNVSKAPHSSVKKQSQANQTSSAVTPCKPPRSTKPQTAPRASIKMSSDVANPSRRSSNLDSPKCRLSSPPKPARRSTTGEARPDAAKTVSSVARNGDKRKICKSASSSPSCTILEDRALLKKGINYTPEKTPAKPEAARRNGAALDRSISLNSVSLDNQISTSISPRWIPISMERRSPEKTRREESALMSRSTSLWSVHAPRADCKKSDARISLIARPSKIPLPASRSTGLGRSLADLSQVDRVREPAGQINFELDLDAAISDERIYENCREILDRTCSKIPGVSKVCSTSTSNLEERAARLMAQLEDDVERKETVVSVADVAPPRRTEIYEDRETACKTDVTAEECNSQDDKSGENAIADEKTKRKKTTVIILTHNSIKSEENSKEKEKPVKECKSNRVNGCKKPEELVEEPKKSKENPNSIQELRRNWERQIQGLASPDAEAKTTCAATSARITVNLTKAVRLESVDAVDGAQETSKRKQQGVGKRAKDIEHLVNFFNCKNAEAVKESPREAPIKPSRPADARIIGRSNEELKSNKSGNEYTGYSSDGNCSEDSGHMSNENEVEWKETIDNPSQPEETPSETFKKPQYFDRVLDRDDDDDDAKIFNTTIASRLAEPEEKKKVAVKTSASTSSGASSIDSSCRDGASPESARQVRLE